MNYKINCTKYLFIILLVLAKTEISRSQQDPYIRQEPGLFSRSSLSIVVPVGAKIISANEQASPDKSNQYALWLEKGDGNYLSSFNGGLDAIPADNKKYPPFMLASRLYEHTRRPPTTATASAISTTAWTRGKISSPKLTAGKSITLFPSIKKIVSEDQMVFCISYTPHIQGKSGYTFRIVFRYNKPGQPVFNEVIPGSSSSIADYGAGNNSVNASNIRTFGSEQVSTTTSTIDLKGFTNALVFDNIQESVDSFNIFISMLPLAGKLPDATSLEAEIFGMPRAQQEISLREPANWLSVGTDAVTNMQTDIVHDPNSVSVSPACITPPLTAQKLHYDIHFQNTGLGDANAVKVIFYFPAHTDITKNITNLHISYSDIPGYTISEQDTQTDYKNGRLIFTLAPADLLDGTKYLDDPVTNPKTMGSISFDLEIAPGNNQSTPPNLQAWAEIYFRGNTASDYAISDLQVQQGLFLAGTEGYERPVRTWNAITVLGNCVACEAKCKCAHPGSIWQWLLCYWWIIVIILLIFVIWWLYKKLRRQH